MDQELLSRCNFANHSLVVGKLEQLLAHEARWAFGSRRLPQLDYIVRR